MNSKNTSTSVDEHEVYEYVYTRKRFNTDLIAYTCVIIIATMFRSINMVFNTEQFSGSLLDLGSFAVFCIMVGVAAKSVVTLRRSRRIGRVDTNTGSLAIVPAIAEPEKLISGN